MNKYFVQWTEKVTTEVTYSGTIEANNVDEATELVENNSERVVLQDYYTGDSIDRKYDKLELITRIK